jgi:hypothetical protein
MGATGWGLVELVARLLSPNEREAVLGDLAEANQNVLRSLFDVLGLFFQRQGVLWRDWRPWLAGFGVALPSCYLLMGVSASVTSTYVRLFDPKDYIPCWPTGREGFILFLCHIFLLIAWSWTAGFVVAWWSRGAVWVSAVLCLFPFCVARFPIESLPRACLYLFLPLAILGARHGLRTMRVDAAFASVLAVAVTALMILAWKCGALRTLNWALIWPVWYLFAAARRRVPVAQTI